MGLQDELASRAHVPALLPRGKGWGEIGEIEFVCVLRGRQQVSTFPIKATRMDRESKDNTLKKKDSKEEIDTERQRHTHTHAHAAQSNPHGTTMEPTPRTIHYPTLASSRLHAQMDDSLQRSHGGHLHTIHTSNTEHNRTTIW